LSSELGVTYSLEFVIKDKKALEAIQNMMKNAQKLVDTLDKVSLEKASKQAQSFKADIKQASDSLKNLNKEKAKTEKKVKNPVKPVEEGAKKANVAMKMLNTTIHDIARGAKYKIGAFLAQQAGQAMKDFSNIDFDIRAAAAKTGGFGKDYKELLKLSNRVGGETTYSNADVAKAINSGATLGIKADEMKSILPSAAQFGQAFHVEDLAYVIEAVKMQMNAYGLSGKDAIKVTDMMAVTSKNTAANLENLREGFKYVGTSAKQLDIPLETLYAMLGKLNDNNILGSSAGTGLNEMFKSMANFKKRGKLEELIGPVTDSKGNLQDVVGIMERLKVVTDKMGNADKASVLQTIFGTRGGRTVGSLLNNNTLNQLKQLQEQIKNSQGMAKFLSDFMMNGPGGAIERFLSTLESAFQSVFSSLAPLIVPVSMALVGLLNIIILINEKVPWLAQLVTIFGALIIGKLVFGALIVKVLEFVSAIKASALAMGGLKLAIMGGIVIALVIAFNLLQRWLDYLSQNEAANREWQAALKALGDTFQSLIGLISEFVLALFGMTQKQRDAKNGLKDTKKNGEDVVQTLKNLRENIEAFRQKIEGAKKWIDDNANSIQEWGKRIIILIGIFKGLSLAVAIFNLAMSLNPLIIVITAVIGIITILWFWLMWLYNNVAWFRDGVNAIWDFIKDHWIATIGLIAGAILAGPLAGAFAAFIGWLIELYNENDKFKSFCDTAWAIIKEVVKSACDIVIKAIEGITGALKGALGALNDLLNGRWGELGNKLASIPRKTGNFLFGEDLTNHFLGAPKNQLKMNTSNIKMRQAKATGTDYFQGWKSGGYTTVDEQGDEAIWLPNGSMVARNTTTRDILNTAKAIRNNTRGGVQGGKTIVNHNTFYIKANDSKGASHEIINELEKLGV
jgi:phage tail tape measure protein, TP901 family